MNKYQKGKEAARAAAQEWQAAFPARAMSWGELAQWQDHFTRLGRKYGLLREYGFERPDGKPWTTKQRHAWRELLEGEDGAGEDDVIIAALELLTGKAWKAFTICGGCQSDWQAGFCPVEEWSREALEAFETEYFNTGTEWIIHDEDGEPESPEEVIGYSVYCVGWNDEQIKRELADAAGESDPAAVVLLKFTGWSRCPEYERAV